jgi:hypothetical protein
MPAQGAHQTVPFIFPSRRRDDYTQGRYVQVHTVSEYLFLFQVHCYNIGATSQLLLIRTFDTLYMLYSHLYLGAVSTFVGCTLTPPQRCFKAVLIYSTPSFCLQVLRKRFPGSNFALSVHRCLRNGYYVRLICFF